VELTRLTLGIEKTAYLVPGGKVFREKLLKLIVWLRHDVTSWHLDCEIKSGQHDYVARVDKEGDRLMVSVMGETRQRTFTDRKSLNEYLAKIGLEELTAEI
jgi:hypothetical protein